MLQFRQDVFCNEKHNIGGEVGCAVVCADIQKGTAKNRRCHCFACLQKSSETESGTVVLSFLSFC